MQNRTLTIMISALFAGLLPGSSVANPALLVEIGHSLNPPRIDGEISDWQDQHWISLAPGPQVGPDAPWWGLRDDGPSEGTPHIAGTNLDLSVSFALQWDEEWIYLAARVTDNTHDVSGGESHQWWLKDSVSLFLDLALDGDGSAWAPGDHAFSFVADPSYPSDGCWWRHGEERGRREVAAPPQTRRAVRLEKSGYVIEAAVPMSVLRRFTPDWHPPFENRTVGFMLLVADPDGGPEPFGGQVTYGGDSDHDAGWAKLRLRPVGGAAEPRLLAATIRKPPPPEDRESEARLRADQRRMLAFFLGAADSLQDGGKEAQLQMAGEYFATYLQEHPSERSARALGMAFSLWGNAGALEPVRAALPQISGQENVWHLILPGLRQAYYLGGHSGEVPQVLADLESRVTPLQSRSALLCDMASGWLAAGRAEDARKAYEQIIVWGASLWHIEESMRGINTILAMQGSTDSE
ncbi:MAG: hypothetical protein HN712_07420 [Gemmatimonadetes bacterium]|nr:hypothetical protein [Gemmatimonadota bacterium]